MRHARARKGKICMWDMWDRKPVTPLDLVSDLHVSLMVLALFTRVADPDTPAATTLIPPRGGRPFPIPPIVVAKLLGGGR
jgi:hypothetical protein